MVKLVSIVVEDVRPMIAGREQTVQFDINNEPVNVRADRSTLSRILNSLVCNASQYSPKGSVIKIRIVKSGPHAEVAVIDNGIGISESDQTNLFTPFFRSEDPVVRERDGWGLNLALAKLLLEPQGGRIECKSRLGQGSTFLMSLPLTP